MCSWLQSMTYGVELCTDISRREVWKDFKWWKMLDISQDILFAWFTDCHQYDALKVCPNDMSSSFKITFSVFVMKMISCDVAELVIATNLMRWISKWMLTLKTLIYTAIQCTIFLFIWCSICLKSTTIIYNNVRDIQISPERGRELEEDVCLLVWRFSPPQSDSA